MLNTTSTPQVLVHFVRNGPSYLPELDAYAAFITARGHQALIHPDSSTVPTNAQVVWWMCGRVPSSEARRLRQAFQIHEYASASVPPKAWLKDQVKHWTQPKPDYRIFQNGWVRERMGFNDGVPHALRDMGVADGFLNASSITASAEFDLVYLGEMNRLLPFLALLHCIHDAGRTLLLIGDVPDELLSQLPASVTCTGRVMHTDVPSQLHRARYGLNLVSNVAPYNQQTSTKVLEYCAVGLPVVSNDYAWVRYFAAHYEGNFHLLRDDPASWPHSFGEALEAYPYIVPSSANMQSLAWSNVLATLPLWRHLHITP